MELPDLLGRIGAISEGKTMSETADNWPKHPDGTNMTIGEMPEADRKRIMREVADRWRARRHESVGAQKISDALDHITGVSDT